MISVRLVYPSPASEMGRIPAGAHVAVVVEPAPVRRAALRGRPLPLAARLTEPISDGETIAGRTLIRTEATRGFAEGNCYLPGQIIDRRA